MKVIVACVLMAVLAGCVTDQAPITPAVAALPPPPKMTWVKPGSTHDEFIRTRGQCELRSMSGLGVPIKNIFDACMNASGWELVEQKPK